MRSEHAIRAPFQPRNRDPILAQGNELLIRREQHGDVVALAGQTPDLRMVRLRGRVVRSEDPLEQRRLVSMMLGLNPTMEVLHPGDTRNVIDAFCIEKAEGECYDLGQRLPLSVPFALGASQRQLSGCFVIGSACTGCRRCAEACPAGCIEAGAPFAIRQEHCLRCGLCAEACPARAIMKVGETKEGSYGND